MTPRSAGKAPIFVSMDVDGNGKDDLIGVEQSLEDNYYPCTILQYESVWSLANFQPSQSMHDGQSYEVSAGFSPFTVTGNSNLGYVLKHE